MQIESECKIETYHREPVSFSESFGFTMPQLSRGPLGAARKNIMKYLLLILFIQMSFSYQKKDFDAIKVGMTNTQVEQLVGLPEDIFRGFPKVEDYEVKVVGQLNYTCWRYKLSKRILFDELDVEEPVKKQDTVFIFNGVESTEYSLKDASKIKDTIFFLTSTPNYKQVITKEKYYDYIVAGKSSLVYCVPVESKLIKIVNNLVLDSDGSIQNMTIHKKYFLVSNLCVLFEPSSSRVVSVEYLPTFLDIKISKPGK